MVAQPASLLRSYLQAELSAGWNAGSLPTATQPKLNVLKCHV
jgi:hypothetical protein